MRYASACVVLLCLLCVGCSNTPGWVKNPPTDSNYFYAVGSCPKTLYGDQRALAGDNARAAIANTIHTHIDDEMVRLQNKYGSRTIDHVRKMTHAVSAADLQGCEVVENWKDDEGLVGPAETTYTLVRIGKADAARAMEKSAAKAAAAEAGEDAAKAFQEVLSDLGTAGANGAGQPQDAGASTEAGAGK